MRIDRGLVAASVFVLAACSDGGTVATPGKPAGSVALGKGPSIDGPLMATPGLWRTTTTVDGRQPFGANRACVSLESQKADDPLGEDQAAAAGCSASRRWPVPGGYAFETKCEQEGLTTHVSGKATGDAKRVTLVTTTRMIDPEGEASPEANVTVESIHLGPCPSGMKPGDSVQEGVSAP